MIFFIQFIRELRNGTKYLIIGLITFVFIMALLLGMSWCSGFVIAKIFNAGQLNSSNYIVYGTYALISVFFVSAFFLSILIWLLTAYKSTVDRIKNNG